MVGGGKRADDFSSVSFRLSRDVGRRMKKVDRSVLRQQRLLVDDEWLGGWVENRLLKRFDEKEAEEFRSKDG